MGNINRKENQSKQPIDRSNTWVYTHLDNLRFMKARFIQRSFQPHFHDYFVISIIEVGVQSFSYGHKRIVTVPGNIIVINPYELHTGEPVTEEGFYYRSLYPTKSFVSRVTQDITTINGNFPLFSGGIIPDRRLFRRFRQLHSLSERGEDALELEEKFCSFLISLIKQHPNNRLVIKDYSHAPQSIQMAIDYLEAHFAEKITLSDLSAVTNVSMYHLARLFKRQVGVPPHRYLECVRIRHAEQALSAGTPLVEAAIACGFSSQTHLTRTFNKVIGTTPGEYKTAKLYKT